MRAPFVAAAALGLLVALPARSAEPADPQVQRRVAEDDQVRIEEQRFRGQTERIVVRNKSGQLKGTQYEIVPVTPARDPSQPGQGGGQRVWHFSF